jgi:very-short-patch-repair endonuclease
MHPNKERIHNIPKLKDSRRSLRNAPTPAEVALWKELQGSKLEGKKFRRQHSVGTYILDFYCPRYKLAIELDGADHYTSEGRGNDIERTAYLNNLHIKAIRFENRLVFEKMDFVLETIKTCFV